MRPAPVAHARARDGGDLPRPRPRGGLRSGPEEPTGVWPRPIHAGDLLGRIGGETLDFGVYNDERVLPGFVVPEHYVRESWKIHTDDPFLYFDEPVRSQILAKDVRAAEPRAGKLDHDVDGRLVGHWFVQGSNGYGGNGGSNCFTAHLAIVPDNSPGRSRTLAR